MSPQRVGGRAAGQPSARGYLAAEQVKWPRAALTGTSEACNLQAGWAEWSLVDHLAGKQREHPTTSPPSWAAMTLGELQSRPHECLHSQSMFAKSHRNSRPQSLYLCVLNKCFKPERLTKLEKKVKGKTVVALRKLNKHIEEAQIQQEQLLRDSRQLKEEKLHVETENKSFLEYLSKNNEHFRRKLEEIWEEYVRECREIEQRRRELESRYARRTADLQAQLLQGEKIRSDLKQQVQALRHISMVKKRQESKVQALQKEKKKIQGETAAVDQQAHFEFLQQKAFLEKQLNEVDMMQMGESKTKEFKSKAQVLELMARKAYFEFCVGVNRENQELQKELGQLIQEYQKLETTRSWLEKQKQQLKEEQWYQEALIRGRQRLQAERERHHNSNRCPKEHSAPKTILSHPLGSKSRINPKSFLQ